MAFDGMVVAMTPGQSKVLRFDQHIKSVYVPSSDNIQATAQTDRLITLTASGPGISSLLVMGDNGEQIFYGKVVVAPLAAEASAEEGHVVRILNWKGGKAGNVQTGGVQVNMGPTAPAVSGSAEETNFYCTSEGCTKLSPAEK